MPYTEIYMHMERGQVPETYIEDIALAEEMAYAMVPSMDEAIRIRNLRGAIENFPSRLRSPFSDPDTKLASIEDLSSLEERSEAKADQVAELIKEEHELKKEFIRADDGVGPTDKDFERYCRWSGVKTSEDYNGRTREERVSVLRSMVECRGFIRRVLEALELDWGSDELDSNQTQKILSLAENLDT